MSRVRASILAGFLLLVVATPAQAQYGGAPPPVDPQVPVAEEDAQAGGTTPCSTILIEGTSWGPGTPVTVERNDPGDPGANMAGECEDEGETVIGVTGTEDETTGTASTDARTAQQPSASNPQQLGTTTAAPDGSFTMAIRVPADVAGTFAYKIIGTDENGAERVVQNELDIVPLVDFTQAADVEGGGLLVWQALLIAAAGIIVLVQLFGGPRLLPRRRS